MGDSQLQIRVARPDDLQTVVRFFERTAYGSRRVGADVIVLTAPAKTSGVIARREVEIYLGLLERRHPGLGASLAG